MNLLPQKKKNEALYFLVERFCWMCEMSTVSRETQDNLTDEQIDPSVQSYPNILGYILYIYLKNIKCV